MNRKILFAALLTVFSMCLCFYLSLSYQQLKNRDSSRLRQEDARGRIKALAEVGSGKLLVGSEQLFVRFSDRNDFVRAKALEAVFRTACIDDIPIDRLKQLTRMAREEPELGRRWAIVLIAAYKGSPIAYETAFNMAVEQLPKMKSPFSKPFMMQVFVLRAIEDREAAAFLESCKSADGPRGRLASEILELTRRDRQKRISLRFFPPALKILELPR